MIVSALHSFGKDFRNMGSTFNFKEGRHSNPREINVFRGIISNIRVHRKNKPRLIYHRTSYSVDV